MHGLANICTFPKVNISEETSATFTHKARINVVR